MKKCLPALIALALPLLLMAGALAQMVATSQWGEVEVKGKAHKRHEHAFVKVEDRFYALGGRRIQPVDVFNPKTKTWSPASSPPMELHHFQALEWEGKILIAGAFTGKFPRETPVGRLFYYDPSSDEWSLGSEIPEERRRGSAGAFFREGKLYLVCGLTDGHRSGWVPWFDEFDFETGQWRQLPDAPRARDHFQAVLVGEKLVLAGGRRSGEGGSVFASVIPEVDVFDFATGEWTTQPSPEGDIPTARAGVSALEIDGQVVVIGGESARPEAHTEVEVLDVEKGTWESWAHLPQGRHATQPILHEGRVYLQAGSVRRGGKETNSLIACPALTP